MRQVCIIIVGLCLPALLWGQAPPETRWQVGLGYTRFKTLDLQHSPLVYSADAGALSVHFSRHFDQASWELGLSLAVGSQQARRFGQRSAYVIDPADIYGERDSFLYVLNPGFSFARASLHGGRYWVLPVDAFRLELGFRAEDVFQFAGLGADSWYFNQLTIAPALRADRALGPGILEAQASMSVLAYTIGLPYVLDPSSPNYPNPWLFIQAGSQIQTLNTFKQARMRLDYRIPIGGHQIGLAYQWDWFQHQAHMDRPLSAYGHSFQFTYSF